jgi:GNAT superfamily N-acetyltransferase
MVLVDPIGSGHVPPAARSIAGFDLVVSETPIRAAWYAILRGLVGHNHAHAGPTNRRPLLIALKGANGAFVGGLAGHSAWGWLVVQDLWLPESLRGRGIGTALMVQAEAEAVARGCHGVWLDTFSFHAPRFYEKLGYAVFGELADCPPGKSRFFLSKRIDGASRAGFRPARREN